MILKEGLHPGVPEAEYHADVCEAPSLSASIAKLLVTRSPLHAWHAHPKLNKDWQPNKPTSGQEIGTAAHALLLGVGKDIREIDAENWRTKVAKEARDKARADGFVPVLADKAPRVRKMVEAARNQLAHPNIVAQIGEAFVGGIPEATLVWQRGPAWARSRLDYAPKKPGRRVVLLDYKTSEGSVEPEAFTRRMYDMQYPLQAAFYEDGWRNRFPETKELLFAFVAQEQDPPYALSVLGLSNPSRGLAQDDVEEAFKVWNACIAADRWPGYPADVCYVDPPVYFAKQREERRLIGQTPSDLLKRALAFQAPHSKEAA